MSDKLLSIVVPVYNESEVLESFLERLNPVLELLPLRCELLFVNDGSSDDTLLQLAGLQQQDERIVVIDLSRNFGKEIAMSAGLDHARGDAVVMIDVDLQDPPELIQQMVIEWQQGSEVVYAKRISRESDSLLKKLSAYFFYRVINRLSNDVHIPEDTGDFRLLDRRVVDALCQLRERHRFMKGLFTWVGFKQTAIPFEREARAAGESKWRYWSLFNFAIEGITSFSTAPLRLATLLGLCTAFAAFLFGLFIIYRTLVFGDPVAGYPSTMVVILFLGGVQLLSLGIIGEYIGRMFNETKQRPLYFVNQVIGGKEKEDDAVS